MFYLCVEEVVSLAEICRMITDIKKYKNYNLFSDQVLVLLTLSHLGGGGGGAKSCFSSTILKHLKVSS